MRLTLITGAIATVLVAVVTLPQDATPTPVVTPVVSPVKPSEPVVVQRTDKHVYSDAYERCRATGQAVPIVLHDGSYDGAGLAIDVTEFDEAFRRGWRYPGGVVRGELRSVGGKVLAVRTDCPEPIDWEALPMPANPWTIRDGRNTRDHLLEHVNHRDISRELLEFVPADQLEKVHRYHHEQPGWIEGVLRQHRAASLGIPMEMKQAAAPVKKKDGAQRDRTDSGEFVAYQHRFRVRVSGREYYVEPGNVERQNPNDFRNPIKTNPANTEMFSTAGGLKIGGVVTVKEIRLPRRPRLFKRRHTRLDVSGRAFDHTHWEYPVGTVTRETAYYEGKPFERRSWEKTATGWQPNIEAIGKAPPGYAPPDDCRSCHQYAGAEAHTIPTIDGRSWWGYGEAPGDDFVISYDPRQ